MIPKSTLKDSLAITAGIIILTLTGIFTVFESRAVIANQLNFSTVLLVMMIGGVGYMTAARTRERGLLASIANGVVGSLICGAGLAVVVVVESAVNMRFVFQNLRSLSGSTVTFGQEVSLANGEIGGLVILLLASAVLGALAALLVNIPKTLRMEIVVAAGLTVIVGLVSRQINDVITMSDALALGIIFTLGYVTRWLLPRKLPVTLGVGLGLGLAAGGILAVMAAGGALESGGLLQIGRSTPTILIMSVEGSLLLFLLVMGAVGVAGALASRASQSIHDAALYLLASLLVLGIMNWQRSLTPLSALTIFALLVAFKQFVPKLGARAEETFDGHSPAEQQTMQRILIAGGLALLLVAPMFTGLYISNVFNLIALYAVMGIGLNVMVGYTGLLDLGYVASFAIGAYTLGILTTPNVLTCGGVHPNQIPAAEIEQVCTGVTTFWVAWPFCVLFSALTGMLLGIPVLRLRGDYLAIVTLGFGEIIHRIILSNDFRPILGGAQGITPIPTPVVNLTALNPEWHVQLNNSVSIYYLFLISVGFAAFVVLRLVNTRTGRAWRAIRADENVARAMGIPLVRYKLMAFGISSAFAGLGGAAFAASVQGIFPNSFTLLVSINVLCLIIIGGMGSVSGVIVGALILIGLPELLRELDAYRLLAFGALLVTVMLVRPEGLLPPSPPRLSEDIKDLKLKEGTGHG
jgi:branched-chain amino acid transport system permease protein